MATLPSVSVSMTVTVTADALLAGAQSVATAPGRGCVLETVRCVSMLVVAVAALLALLLPVFGPMVLAMAIGALAVDLQATTFGTDFGRRVFPGLPGPCAPGAIGTVVLVPVMLSLVVAWLCALPCLHRCYRRAPARFRAVVNVVRASLLLALGSRLVLSAVGQLGICSPVGAMFAFLFLGVPFALVPAWPHLGAPVRRPSPGPSPESAAAAAAAAAGQTAACGPVAPDTPSQSAV